MVDREVRMYLQQELRAGFSTGSSARRGGGSGGGKASNRGGKHSRAAHTPALQLSRPQRVKARYRFVSVVGGGSSKRGWDVDWQDTAEVCVELSRGGSGEFRCPVCLTCPIAAPHAAACGHAFCWPCWLRYCVGTAGTGSSSGSGSGSVSVSDLRRSSSVPCPVCSEWVGAFDTRPVRITPLPARALPAPAPATATATATAAASEGASAVAAASLAAQASRPGLVPDRLAPLCELLEDADAAATGGSAAAAAMARSRRRSNSAASTGSSGGPAVAASASRPVLSHALQPAHCPSYLQTVYAAPATAAAATGTATATASHAQPVLWMAFRLLLVADAAPLASATAAAAAAAVDLAADPAAAAGLVLDSPLRLAPARMPTTAEPAATFTRTAEATRSHMRKVWQQQLAELQRLAGAAAAEVSEAADAVNAILIAALGGDTHVSGTSSSSSGSGKASSSDAAASTSTGGSNKGAWGDKRHVRALMQTLDTQQQQQQLQQQQQQGRPGSSPLLGRSASAPAATGGGGNSIPVRADGLASAAHAGSWSALGSSYGLHASQLQAIARRSDVATDAEYTGNIIAWAIAHAHSQLDSLGAAAADEEAEAEASAAAAAQQGPLWLPVAALKAQSTPTSSSSTASTAAAAGAAAVVAPVAQVVYQSVSGELAFLQHHCAQALLAAASTATAPPATASSSSSSSSGGGSGSTAARLPEWQQWRHGLPALIAAPIVEVEQVRVTPEWLRGANAAAAAAALPHLPLGALIHLVEVDLRRVVCLDGAAADRLVHCCSGSGSGSGSGGLDEPLAWRYLKVPREAIEASSAKTEIANRAIRRAKMLERDGSGKEAGGKPEEKGKGKGKGKAAGGGGSRRGDEGSGGAGRKNRARLDSAVSSATSASGGTSGVGGGASEGVDLSLLVADALATTTAGSATTCSAAAAAAAAPAAHNGGGGKPRSRAELYREYMGISDDAALALALALDPRDPGYAAAVAAAAALVGQGQEEGVGDLADARQYPSLGGGHDASASASASASATVATTATATTATPSLTHVPASPPLGPAQPPKAGFSFATITSQGGFFPSLPPAKASAAASAAASASAVAAASPPLAPTTATRGTANAGSRPAPSTSTGSSSGGGGGGGAWGRGGGSSSSGHGGHAGLLARQHSAPAAAPSAAVPQVGAPTGSPKLDLGMLLMQQMSQGGRKQQGSKR